MADQSIAWEKQAEASALELVWIICPDLPRTLTPLRRLYVVASFLPDKDNNQVHTNQ